jgi:TM2 domain-containing membrane protein YozV
MPGAPPRQTRSWTFGVKSLGCVRWYEMIWVAYETKTRWDGGVIYELHVLLACFVEHFSFKLQSVVNDWNRLTNNMNTTDTTMFSLWFPEDPCVEHNGSNSKTDTESPLGDRLTVFKVNLLWHKHRSSKQWGAQQSWMLDVDCYRWGWKSTEMDGNNICMAVESHFCIWCRHNGSTNPCFSSRTDLQELQTQMKKAAVVKFSLCVCRPCVLSMMHSFFTLFQRHCFAWSAMELDALGHSHDVSLRPGTIRSSRSFADAGLRQIRQRETDMICWCCMVLNGIALWCFIHGLQKLYIKSTMGKMLIMHRIWYTLCPFPEHRYRLPWLLLLVWEFKVPASRLSAYLFVSLRFLSRSLHQIALSNIRTGTQHESVASVWDCLLRYSGILW